MRTVSALASSKTAFVSTTIEGFFSLVLARLSYKSTGVVFLILAFLFFEALFPNRLFAFSETGFTSILPSPLVPETKSLFSEKLISKSETIKFAKRTVVDDTLSEGETKILTVGKLGKKTYQTRIVYHDGKEFSREKILAEDIKPVEEVLAISASALDNLVDTPAGKLKYSHKLSVWATSYDSTCRGCNETTAIGLKAGYGVVAVDPKIIPLRSKIYIPGYGVAVAGDTGGSIKGNKIDLGFDDLVNADWTARYTDIYILSE